MLKFIRFSRAGREAAQAERRGDHRAEIAAAERMVAIDPKHSLGRAMLAAAVERTGDRARALQLWYDAAAVDANDFHALQRIADIHAEQGDVDLACAAIKRALALPPLRPLSNFEERVVRFFARLSGAKTGDHMKQAERETDKARKRWTKWAEGYLRVHARERDDVVN
jgi:tetratricopeptide (TPR) repeat protein